MSRCLRTPERTSNRRPPTLEDEQAELDATLAFDWEEYTDGTLGATNIRIISYKLENTTIRDRPIMESVIGVEALCKKNLQQQLPRQ